jgi:CoA-transferase family III
MRVSVSGKSPLHGIRAFGMRHVIAGGAIGRDLALYGADVLNIWRPSNSEVEAFAWDVQVGMRTTILDDSKEDRATFARLLRNADVFLANKCPGFLRRHDLDALASDSRSRKFCRVTQKGTARAFQRRHPALPSPGTMSNGHFIDAAPHGEDWIIRHFNAVGHSGWIMHHDRIADLFDRRRSC